MSARPDWHAELHDLLDRLHDGGFDNPDRLRLNELLRAGAPQREYFITYMDVHSRLAWDGGQREVGESQVMSGSEEEGLGFRVQGSGFSVGDLSVDAAVELPSGLWPRIPNPEPQVPPLPSPSLPTTHYPLPTTQFVGGPVFSYLTSAVIVGMMLLGAWAYKITLFQQQMAETPKTAPSIEKPEMVFVGRITGMADVKWSDDKDFLPPLGFAYVPLGRKYKLDSGLMQITYDSGAKVILQGPCTYEVESRAGGYLALGKLTARVESGGLRVESEENATNQKSSQLSTLPSPLFSVRTPTAVITDLGTEFGVEVSSEGNTTSQVFRGSVKVQLVGGDGTQQDVVLRENESAQVMKVDGNPSITRRTATEAVGFVRSMPLPRAVRDSQAYSELVLSLNPTVYYRMERSKKGTGPIGAKHPPGRSGQLDPSPSSLVFDSAPGGHHGTLRLGNELEWWPYRRGRWGDALWFRGSRISDYVYVPDYPKATEDKLSVSVWVTAEKWRDSWPIIVADWGKPQQLGQFDVGFYRKECNLIARVTQRGGTLVKAREGRDFPMSEWQHVAFVVDGTMLRLYRNGEEVARAECDGLRPDPLIRNLAIGGNIDNVTGRIPGRFWRGMIDELAVFNAALSAEQIHLLYVGKPFDSAGGTGVSPVQELGRGIVGSTGERPVSPNDDDQQRKR